MKKHTYNIPGKKKMSDDWDSYYDDLTDAEATVDYLDPENARWAAEDKKTSKYQKSSKKKSSGYTSCWKKNHKPFKLLNGKVYGGACAHPAKGYDIYVGLDWGMHFTTHEYPWEKSKSEVVEFLFKITDGCATKDVKNFKKMITWLCAQLEDGKKIQIGCIGGHGRTGLVLAALVAEATGEKDAIAWVRKTHCKKAVESESQVNFLVKHYKVKKAEPSKQSYKNKVDGSKHGSRIPKPIGVRQVNAVQSFSSIW